MTQPTKEQAMTDTTKWEKFRPQPGEIWQARWQARCEADFVEWPQDVGKAVVDCDWPGGIDRWQFRRPIKPATAPPEIARSEFDRMTYAEKAKHNLPAFLAIGTSLLEVMADNGVWEDWKSKTIDIRHPFRVKTTPPDMMWRMEFPEGRAELLFSPVTPSLKHGAVRVVRLVATNSDREVV